MKKVVLVVGASSDIGFEVTNELMGNGNYVVIPTYYSKPHVNLPNTQLQLDLTEPQSVMNFTGQDWDAIVTTSFPFIEGDAHDMETFDQVQALLRGHMLLFSKVMERRTGPMSPMLRIVNILGQCVNRGIGTAAHYSAAFAYLHNWGKSVNASLGRANRVQVCDVLAGPVATRMWHGVSQETMIAYQGKVSQFNSPRAIAQRVVFELEQPVMATELLVESYYSL